MRSVRRTRRSRRPRSRRCPSRRRRSRHPFRGSGIPRFLPLPCPGDGDCLFHAVYRSAAANGVALRPSVPGFPTAYTPHVRRHLLEALPRLEGVALEDRRHTAQRLRLPKHAGYAAWGDVWDCKILAAVLSAPICVLGLGTPLRFDPDGTADVDGSHWPPALPCIVVRLDGQHFVPLARTPPGASAPA